MTSSQFLRALKKRGRPPAEDVFILDYKKSDFENIHEIINGLNSSPNESKRLSLLNACTKLLSENSTASKNYHAVITIEEFLYCLSSNLVHNFTQIRAGTLRSMRYLLRTPGDLQIFNNLQIPLLVCRSLDILLKNEEERTQALKLIRKMLVISPELLSPGIVRCLVSLCESDNEDRMLRACLATLCELSVLNPNLMITCGGVSVITRNLVECHSPRIAESLCGVLLYLLDFPHTRNMAGVRLDCLAAAYCDFTYRLGIMDKNKDARDLRFTCSRLALISALRSWGGTLEFCNPNKASGLKAIIDILYLNQLDVRKAILDLFYDLIGLPHPVWTDEFLVAFSVVDPSDFLDIWRLTEGFVANEGRSVLPTLAARVPNICEIHTSMLLYCFIENGLLNALVEVIISTDSFLSVRATVLLAKMLQLMHTLLPADICSASTALPKLVSKATEGNHQAKAAISALQHYHKMLRNRPASCSMFLDSIVQSGDLVNSRLFKRELNAQDGIFSNKFPQDRTRHDSFGSSGGDSFINFDLRDSASIAGDESTLSRQHRKRASFKRLKFLQIFDNSKENERLIRDTNVLQNKDPISWDWETINIILKSHGMNKSDDNQLRFIRTLVHYFKPTSNRFSHQELGLGRLVSPIVTAGLELIEWLIQHSEELENMRILTDFCTDISDQLSKISNSRSAHDCLFSPNHMSSTMCQMYFLFIGRMSKHKKGIEILKNTDIFKNFVNLVTSTNHPCYVKLVVSCLDYTVDSQTRMVLQKALTKGKLAGRLYATQFLLVLLRARLPLFEDWGISLILGQLVEKEHRSIVLATLDILDEACHENSYLLEVVHVWPKLLKFKYTEIGKYIMMRFFSTPRGLNHSNANIRYEVDQWINSYNKRYVLYIESETHASLTLHTKNEEGIYSRRGCADRPEVTPTILPGHLYGSLVQTTQGMNNLQKYGNVLQLIDFLNQGKCYNEEECLNLKSALWAIGHVSTNADGVEYLNDPVSRVYEKIINLAKFCEVYSIRSTALNVLCLISSSQAGSNALFKHDWVSVRHARNTCWPVNEPEDLLGKQLTPVRGHLFEDVPPYNYTTIDEASLLNATNNNNNTTFYFDTSSENTREDGDQTDAMNVSGNSSARSRTLPTASQHSQRAFNKHMRSLSESKTTEAISSTAHTRTRFNSGTDSNTSGVSSCDSVMGRNIIIAEMHQTLSPIPSSSNLNDTKKSSDERFRRTSLTGAPIRDASSMTPQDLNGYKKLRQIRKNLRSVWSESAADDLTDIFEHHDNITFRPKNTSISESQRRLKVRSLDRQYSFNSTGNEDQKGIYVSKLTHHIDTKGPCYTGICLPRNILDLFPEEQSTGTYVSRYVQELGILESNNLSTSSILKNQFLNESTQTSENAVPTEEESVMSSTSDLSSNGKRNRKWTAPDESADSSPRLVGNVKHYQNDCLLCCRKKVLCSSSMMISNKKKHPQDGSFYSPESHVSDDSNVTTERVTTIILRNVEKMANPIIFKQVKQTLLELKQKFPAAFQDICLYSEVSKCLANNTYRLHARRLIQEIFLDLNFALFETDVDQILEQIVTRLKNVKIAEPIEEIATNPTTHNVQVHANQAPPNASLPQHSKIHAIKSPQLESVYETSIENLVEARLDEGDEVDGSVVLRAENKEEKWENLANRHSSVNENLHINENTSVRRKRFNTLELDLSCSRNKFPIGERRKKDFSPTEASKEDEHSNTSLSSNNSIVNLNKNKDKPAKSVSSSAATTPTQQGALLFCEQRLQTSKSEATLNNKK